jgi:N,N-dimethylformamidase
VAELIGYADRWSVRAGDTVTMHVHADAARTVTADLVALTRFTDAYRTGAPVVGSVPQTLVAAPQRTPIGSCARAPLPALSADASFTFSILARPTSPYPGTIAALAGSTPRGVTLRWTGAGALQLVDHQDIVRCELPLDIAQWSVISLIVAESGCTVQVQSHRYRPAVSYGAVTDWSPRATVFDTLWLAAQPDATGAPLDHFDGLLEAPLLFGDVLSSAVLAHCRERPGAHETHRALLASWDFAQAVATDRIIDTGPHALHGTTVQGPTRLIPGAFWQPGVLDPVRDPTQFAAIHFHSDDLQDAAWTPSTRLTIPATLASGVYGVRLTDAASDAIDVIPLWVRAHAADAARPLAFLAPTYSYLAYGNAPDAMLGPAYWGADHPAEQARRAHPEFGLSLYSRHRDHSGTTLASRHRPLLTVRPGVRPWGFEADRLLTHWMDASGYAFDVLTDEDLDRDGLDALSPHRVIVTGNHPEYWSAGMLDSLDRWLQQGGRLVYTGGNGFYWRISSLEELPGVIECRRPEGGTRPWIAEPGCGHHQFDGASGGLWRRLGRPPQRMVGVGFAGQGFARSAPYRVRAEARVGWSAFALEGVSTELIGTTGRFGGGAAGQEIDRHDVRLGSSRDAVVLATSQGLHDEHTLRTVEELLSHEPFAPDPKVRADLTLTPVPGGGAVFSTGSMAWVGALEDAGVSRVMRNVIDRFLDPAALGADEGSVPGRGREG